METTTNKQNPFLLTLVVFILAGQFGRLRAMSVIENGATFDFIVAGGGTAGCAVAARLAESGEHTVLLIEAGGIPHPDLDVPALAANIRTSPEVRRVYPSVRHGQAALATNGVVDVIRGNTLGGSSAINSIIFSRGSPHDYNNWAKLTGDDSWSYANMLQHFRKLENYTGPNPTNQRGFNGPITISRALYAPGANEWIRAGQELGFPIADPNGPQIVSFARIDQTLKRGRRVTSYKGYIETMLQTSPSIRRSIFATTTKSNLLILINTEVKRILFQGNRAVGVEFISTNSSQTPGHAVARKEVILSTGAINSPEILMKSGIGPKSELDKFKIPPVQYLPVGRNLHDHPLVSLIVAFGNRSAALDEDRDLTPEALRFYEETGEGPYSSFTGINAQAFLPSAMLSPEERSAGWADIQYVPIFSNVRNGNWDRDALTDVRPWEIPMHWVVFVARPKSRGSITLNATDFNGNPVIDFQYLTHPYDIRVMVEALKTGAKICENTRAFQSVGCRVIRWPIPTCDRLSFRSDQYWECYARHVTQFGYHAVGTCRMGRGPGDPEAVVDSKMGVIGIENLRVVDASIIPVIPTASTQAAVYAIAEKAADLIQQKWKGNRQTGMRY